LPHRSLREFCFRPGATRQTRHSGMVWPA